MRCVTLQFDRENIKSAWFSIYFALHRAVWGESPASLMEKTLNLRDYLFCVTSNCMRCVTRQFDRENIKSAWLFISRYIELYEVSPASLIEKTLNLRDYLFRVTSNCARCVTRQFNRENIKSAWLFISRYIELYEVCHPPVWWRKH